MLTAYAVFLTQNQEVGVRSVNLNREEQWRLGEFSKPAVDRSTGSKSEHTPDPR